MYKVLVVDFSLYKDVIARMFQSAGYSLEVCESAYDAISKLKAFDFDLIVSEVELPGDNAFDLYNYIQKHYPYIPMIMTTEKVLDKFFSDIFSKGIGNVLCKPVKKDDMLNLAEKLITKKNIFGLQNYMKDIKKIRVKASLQIPKALAKILEQIEGWGFSIENKIILNLVLNEMAINAVYHSHGYTIEKEQRIPIKLKEGEYVDIFFGMNDTSFGISITDYKGKLSKHKILESINNVIEQNNLIVNAVEKGEDIYDKVSQTGRGIDLVRKLCGEYYFIIKKDVMTEIILLFDRELSYDSETYTSIKIIEDISQP
jgi:CheY-like chemotaxis protein